MKTFLYKCLRRIHKYISSIFAFLGTIIRCMRLHIGYKPGCYIGSQVSRWGSTKIIMERNSAIAKGCVLWGNGTIKIGNGTHIGEYSWIHSSPEGGVSFGNNVNVAAFLYLIDTDHGTRLNRGIMMKQPLISQKVSIGNDVWIGAHVTILKGVIVSNGCVLGACSCVTKSFPENAIVAGVPARLIKMRE